MIKNGSPKSRASVPLSTLFTGRLAMFAGFRPVTVIIVIIIQ
jgi:hypothetical protein